MHVCMHVCTSISTQHQLGPSKGHPAGNVAAAKLPGPLLGREKQLRELKAWPGGRVAPKKPKEPRVHAAVSGSRGWLARFEANTSGWFKRWCTMGAGVNTFF